MIVFLNGAFGVGKASTARALYQALPESLIFDPESVGAMLSDTLKEREDGWCLRHMPLVMTALRP